MTRILQEYKQRKPRGATDSIYVEDYEFQYGKINYTDRVVLDVGADIGSTAHFFLEKGANLLVAVEGSKQCFKELKANAKSCKKIVAIECFINHPDQIEALILRWKPNIVKLDIEGSEIHLFSVADNVFCSVQEYLIEVHNEDLLRMLRKKCDVNGFEIVSLGSQSPSNPMPPYIINIRKN
jgi:hypothetical protein